MSPRLHIIIAAAWLVAAIVAFFAPNRPGRLPALYAGLICASVWAATA